MLLERAAREWWWCAAPVEPEQPLVHPAADAADGHDVRDRSKAAAPFRHAADVADDACPQRHAVPLPVAGEKLALEPRDIYAHGALRLARAAFETEVENVMNVVIGQPRMAQSAGHRQPQRVRTAARGVLLFPRRHVRRTHCPLERLPARAQTAA